MLCPVCLEGMETYNAMGIEIDVCSYCGGAWFDHDELSQYVKKGEMPIQALHSVALDPDRKIAPEGRRMCPRCKNMLSLSGSGGVVIDHCHSCGGFWFDRGELLKVLKIHVQELRSRSFAAGKTMDARVGADSGQAGKEKPPEAEDSPIFREFLSGNLETVLEAAFESYRASPPTLPGEPGDGTGIIRRRDEPMEFRRAYSRRESTDSYGEEPVEREYDDSRFYQGSTGNVMLDAPRLMLDSVIEFTAARVTSYMKKRSQR